MRVVVNVFVSRTSPTPGDGLELFVSSGDSEVVESLVEPRHEISCCPATVGCVRVEDLVELQPGPIVGHAFPQALLIHFIRCSIPIRGAAPRETEDGRLGAVFDSGLEYPETYDYIGDLAREWSLDLHRIPADPPLLDVLAASGLWDHGASSRAGVLPNLHEVLISGPSRRAHELLGPGELWGVRADESAGRRAMYTRGGRRDGIVVRVDGTVAYGGRSGTGAPQRSGPTSGDMICPLIPSTPSSWPWVFPNGTNASRMSLTATISNGGG